MASGATEKAPRARERLCLRLEGAVQGVGFRPFVYRLAHELGLVGSVRNDAAGALVDIEGQARLLETFRARLRAELPAPGRIVTERVEALPPTSRDAFVIETSDDGGIKRAIMLPELATCDACRREVDHPSNRRHRYPFTNCTHCGPRYSIIRALPYDRPQTSMASFVMCADCQREYDDPADRRFHAQPNACPACGPRLALTDVAGNVLARDDAALLAAASALEEGQIVAVKGLGGFHLMVDAARDDSVGRLRERKHRPQKALGLMVRDLAMAHTIAELAPDDEVILQQPEAPLLLVRRRADAPIGDAIAPHNPYVALMLPATPLHHLLCAAVGRPLVATSGNLSDEPICITNDEARTRLGAIADLFLEHDRPIVRHVDDSLVWRVGGKTRLLRRARGYAPLPLPLPEPSPTVLAVGPELKSTVALALGEQLFVTRHIGDLETPEAQAAFERAAADLVAIYEAEPVAIAHDLHPDYVSTRFAETQALPRIAVQHHHAHLAACLLDAGDEAPALGVIWDGTGLGDDGTIWGGEFLLGDAAAYERRAHLRPFRLLGGDAAAREPWRVALALLWELEGESAFCRLANIDAVRTKRELLTKMLTTGFNSPWSTSAGRLFDGVASLLGLCQAQSFEGEAAMRLEFAATNHDPNARYPLPLVKGDDAQRDRPRGTAVDRPRAGPQAESRGAQAGRSSSPPLVLDWAPMLEALIRDQSSGIERSVISSRFHATLVDAIAATAEALGQARVALSGGCFQNRRLFEGAVSTLLERGHAVLVHEQLPPNDGCISAGQARVAAARLRQPTVGG